MLAARRHNPRQDRAAVVLAPQLQRRHAATATPTPCSASLQVRRKRLNCPLLELLFGLLLELLCLLLLLDTLTQQLNPARQPRARKEDHNA